jgi:hypothetical protein
MILHKNVIPNYFEIASPINSHYKVATNTFDFINRQSDILLVTVGESWVYGSDLCDPNDNITRLELVFGNLVSKEMKADWLNLGQPGAGNFWIAEKVEELGKIVPLLNYKKIYLVCVFTEVGRSFDSHHDRYIDYIDWFAKNDNFDDFLKFLNAECVKRILVVAEKFHINLLVGTNFIDGIGMEKLGNNFLSIPWFRLLNIDAPTSYTGLLGVSKLHNMKGFIPFKKQSQYLEWFNNLLDTASVLSSRLNNSSRLVGLQHPNALSHNEWAEYLLNNLK